jgi:hypothetical protein
METKTPGYPRKIYVEKGLLIGGNWVGPNAINDEGPKGTFLREVREKLSFNNSVVDPAEMAILFGTDHSGHSSTSRNITPTAEDEDALKKIIQAIEANAKPFHAFIQEVEKSVFDMGDPKNKAGKYQGLTSVFEVPLPDDEWFALVDLQQKYGNISNESQSLITSVWKIVEKNIRIAWGQDIILQDFFVKHKLVDISLRMNLMPMTRVTEVPFKNS